MRVTRYKKLFNAGYALIIYILIVYIAVNGNWSVRLNAKIILAREKDQ